MAPIIFTFPGNELLAERIIKGINAEKGTFLLRRFPDAESYVRVLSNVEKRDVIVVCTMQHPDDKLLPLTFLCQLLKDMKAKSICLVAPYLAYMRQDKQFCPGEAVTSVYFARLLSSFADKIITVDPHLHRRTSMKEIYSIPCEVLHAAGLISNWIKNEIKNPLLVGPDSESEQWVSEVAKNANAPFVILEKKRKGEKDVEISVPHVEKYKEHTPVLVDDIISTAKTMIETVKHLRATGMKPPVCIGVHAVFAGEAYNELLDSGVKEIITCNTIPHTSNVIDISTILIPFLKNESYY